MTSSSIVTFVFLMLFRIVAGIGSQRSSPPTVPCASVGSDCSSCGYGYITCGDNTCYNPDAGEICCQETYICPAGYSCADDDSLCCTQSLPEETCTDSSGLPSPSMPITATIWTTSITTNSTTVFEYSTSSVSLPVTSVFQTTSSTSNATTYSTITTSSPIITHSTCTNMSFTSYGGNETSFSVYPTLSALTSNTVVSPLTSAISGSTTTPVKTSPATSPTISQYGRSSHSRHIHLGFLLSVAMGTTFWI